MLIEKLFILFKIALKGGHKMEIGNKINQLRKLSGMTQEQLAEKLNVSRQTISKWESDSTSPDLESIVKISRIFHVSLDDLLKEGEAGVANKTDEQITLEDLMKINLHNRKMTLLLISGLIFIMVSILNFAYVIALQSTTLSTQYMLYRYIVTGQYENAPIDYMRLMIPSIIAAAIGVILFISYTIERRKKETENMYKAKKFISYMALCVLIFSLCACGEKVVKTLLFMEKLSENWKIMSFLQLLIQMLLYLFYLLPHKYIMTVWEIRQHLIVMYII